MKNKEEILKSGLLKYNIVPDDQILSSFLKYMELLIEKNKTINLTAINDPKEIIVEHFSILYRIKTEHNQTRYEDDRYWYRSRLPGLPIKIVMTDIETTFRFIKNCKFCTACNKYTWSERYSRNS